MVGWDMQKPTSTTLETRRLGPVAVAMMTQDQALGTIVRHVVENTPLNVAFANTNLVMQAHRNPDVAANLSDFLVLNDGIGLELGCRMVHGQGFPDNLNGTDFTPRLLQNLPKGTKVFLYGSKPHVVAKAQSVVEKTCGVTVVGVQDGYAAVRDEDLCQRINASGAQVVLVATGNPRQEAWMARNRAALQAPVCVGVGALLDFMTGEFKRAPAWVQKAKLEWLYRLMQEPTRLARRYTLDVLDFLWVCRKYGASA